MYVLHPPSKTNFFLKKSLKLKKKMLTFDISSVYYQLVATNQYHIKQFLNRCSFCALNMLKPNHNYHNSILLLKSKFSFKRWTYKRSTINKPTYNNTFSVLNCKMFWLFQMHSFCYVTRYILCLHIVKTMSYLGLARKKTTYIKKYNLAQREYV